MNANVNNTAAASNEVIAVPAQPGAVSRFFTAAKDKVAAGYDAIPTSVKVGTLIVGSVSAGVALQRSGALDSTLEKIGSLFTRTGEAVQSAAA